MSPDQPRSWVQPYYPAFNALRGLAVTLVFSAHYLPLFTGKKMFSTGWVGVDLFFVMSGFLITGILFDARDSPDYFRNFYIRRALRIFPLYWGFFLLVLLFWPVLRHGTSEAIWTYALYIGNLVQPFITKPSWNPSIIKLPSGLGSLRIDHFWSLCVEEQFYLAWPVAIRLICCRKKLMTFCLVVICVTLCLRAFLFFFAPTIYISQSLLYKSTFTRCDSLLVGGLLALWLRGARLTKRRFLVTAHCLLWPSLIAFTIGQRFTWGRWPHPYSNPFVSIVGYDLLAIAAVGLLMWSMQDDSAVFAWLRRSPLAPLGVVSYGFYILHELYEPIFEWRIFPYLHRLGVHRGLSLVLCFLFTWGLAWLSYRFYESPFIALKGKLAPSHKQLQTVAAD